MDAVFDFGLAASRWLQETYPQLANFFAMISSFGTEEFYLSMLPLVYWSWDKRLGKHLAYVYLFSYMINGVLKFTFRGPRPYWLATDMAQAEEVSYGVPSGHTQLAATVYFFLAGWFNKRWLWLLATIMVLLMMTSRVYLGEHFVHDVVVGLLVAGVILLGYVIWRRMLAEDFKKRILGQRLMAAVLIPTGLAGLYIIIRLIIGEPNTAVAWADFLDGAELSSLKDIATGFGALLGAGIGLVMEKSRVRFQTEGPLWKRGARFVVGIVVTVAIWGGLKSIFPEDPLWLAVPLRIVRYFLATLWITYYAPWTFVKLKIADAAPEPGITLKI